MQGCITVQLQHDAVLEGLLPRRHDALSELTLKGYFIDDGGWGNQAWCFRIRREETTASELTLQMQPDCCYVSVCWLLL